ncbi:MULTISPECIES: hypothetical protein [unclassified Rhodanobacter]|nr:MULTISPECIES: hypothetical protein [unclassified Rhodanobacter]
MNTDAHSAAFDLRGYRVAGGHRIAPGIAGAGAAGFDHPTRACAGQPA